MELRTSLLSVQPSFVLLLLAIDNVDDDSGDGPHDATASGPQHRPTAVADDDANRSEPSPTTPATSTPSARAVAPSAVIVEKAQEDREW